MSKERKEPVWNFVRRCCLRKSKSGAKYAFPASIQFVIQVPEDVWNINGDVGQLHQVFLNLLKNARDAMPDGGEITITVTNTVVGNDLAESNPDAVPGKFVQFCIYMMPAAVSLCPMSIEFLSRFIRRKKSAKERDWGCPMPLALSKDTKDL